MKTLVLYCVEMPTMCRVVSIYVWLAAAARKEGRWQSNIHCFSQEIVLA